MVPKSKMWRKVFGSLLGVCTLAGAAVFFPRPTVSPPSMPFDPTDKFSVSFEISNNGYIPLNDCTAMLGVGQISGASAHFDPSFIPSFKSRLVMPAWQHHRLGMDDRFTVVLSDLLQMGVQSADIAIVVSYKPWFLPIRREKIYRFVTISQTGARQTWRSWPPDEPLTFASQQREK